MRTVFFLPAIVASLLLMNCTNETTLQKYFVENSNNKDFIELNLASSLINTDKMQLTADQKTALESFSKLNILTFKLDKNNKLKYEIEIQKVTAIVKNKKYQELMKIGSGKDGASVSFVGDENHINEFVLFAQKKENGFAVVRILGKDMNPNNIMNMISLLKSSNVNLEQLKPLQDLIKQ